MVRGKDISFAPSDIKRVLKLKKEPLPNAASYHKRKANKDYRLDHVLKDLCVEGGEWVCHKDGRPHYLKRADLEPMTKGWYDFVCRSILPTTNRSELTVERAVLIHSIIIGENINDDNLIPQEPPIVGEAMIRVRETRARNSRASQARQEAPPQQQPPQEQSQPQTQHMYFPYQNTSRQFKEMETQGIPVTIANLAIHRHREEEMNREMMRHNQSVQEASAARAREANKSKAREVVPYSEEESEELASSASEEW
ncbi:hypothetical protein PIB30_003511 [Stylosanthes scabra]|uniref:Putative plant transposon protein domain-containing protein n=1 Tax=Stylosanthes scabra TaxID=79078 RepID=A0ABU6W4L5_9FABA|nr:hypothetical protein [Stylosanthes scabra]